MKMKMKLKNTTKAIIAVSIFAMCNSYAGQGGSLYTQVENNTFKLDIDFNLKLIGDVFQFHGENLSRQQERINEELISFLNKSYQEYKSRFEDFVDIISRNHYSTLGHENELEVWYELHRNSDNLFSIILYSRETGGGGNGCRTNVRAFNYILGTSTYVSNLSLDKVLKDDKSYLLLLEEINIELAKRDTPLKARIDNLVDSMEFAFAEDELIVNFNAYTVGCGADCIVDTKLKYSRIKDLLSADILQALKLL